MKRIFCFLLVAIGFLSTEKAFAEKRPITGGKVRYAIEMKTISKTDAENTLTTNGGVGYIDLWTYLLVNESFVTNNVLELNADGSIKVFGIQTGGLTHTYTMVYKDGSNDTRARDNYANCVAAFARPNPNQCDASRPAIYQRDVSTSGAVMGNVTYSGVCPTWAYGASAGNSAAVTEYVSDRTEVMTIDGETWYALKMYRLRFEYKKAESFYVTFYTGPSIDLGATGASNLNIYDRYGTGGDELVWDFYNTPGYSCSQMDWSQTHANNQEGSSCKKPGYYDFVMGGVEVIADPDMTLTAEATCGGTDLPGKLSVNDWAGKTWADYSGVKFYVNTTGGTVSGRKQVSAGDLTATIPTTGTAAEIAYTLTPSGYTMPDGSYADSLIWVIEDTFLA